MKIRWFFITSLISFFVVLMGIILIKQYALPLQVEIVAQDQRIVWPVHKTGNFHIKTDFGEMKICIENGFVWVASSSCPDQICIKAGKISENGQIILCAPNRVFIQMITEQRSKKSDILTY